MRQECDERASGFTEDSCENMNRWTSHVCEAILDPNEPITFATPKMRFAKVMSFEELRKNFGFSMTLQLFLRDLRIFARKNSR
jgi:hypothetical protein